MTNHIIYTVIFSPYETLKDPLVITEGWIYLCFTDQDFVSDTWIIIKVPEPVNARLEARKYKALFYDCVSSRFSLYIDGSFQINCNLDDFFSKYFKAPFSCPSHPQRNCVYKEAESVLRGERPGSENLEKQIERYSEFVPPNNGLITSGILLREDTPECRALCLDWWLETSYTENSRRDQISFAKVSMQYKDIISTFDYPYIRRSEFIFHPHREFVKHGINFI